MLKPDELELGAIPRARLIERSSQHDGNTTEVFEVAPGELVVVASWSVDEVTHPERPRR